MYHECFFADYSRHGKINPDLAAEPWIDGAERVIKIYSCSISKCIKFLRHKCESGSEVAQQLLEEVFMPIASGAADMVEKFVKTTVAREIVSVISCPKPWDRTKFLTHLCLSLGRYETEIDIFCSGDIKEAFFNAGLMPSSASITRIDILRILKQYIITDLAFQPINARQFDRMLKAALHTLQDVFLDGVEGNYTPCLSEIMLKEQATDQLKNYETTRKLNLVRGLFEDLALADCLPQHMEDATIDMPIDWIPTIQATDGISLEAIAEQSQALRHCADAINFFTDPMCRGLKFPCLVGRPGSGKSHVLKIACAYALCKGLQVELMSFTSERARKLGGNHVHLVFPLTVNKGKVPMSHEIIHDCLKNLEKDPLKTAVIKRTDVFFIEEIGLISSQMFTALDSILQYLMGKLFVIWREIIDQLWRL